jgi:hypothetical protein
MAIARRALLIGPLAAAAGCTVAYRTGVIRKDLLTDAQQVIADTKINHGGMTIQCSADRADTAYEVGQPITLSVTVSKDAHVAILRTLANGSTALLFPNRPHPKSDIRANETLTVPGTGGRVTIAVDKPGVVLFEFIASTDGDSWLFKRAADEGSAFADLGGATRAIAKDIVDSLKLGASHDTAAIYLTARIGSGPLF